MQAQLKIRKACSADTSRVSELVCKAAHCFVSSASGEVAPWFLASISSTAIAGYIADAKFNYLVGFLSQTLAGVIAVRNTTHVYHLFVASEFRRQGVAAKLWEHAKEDAIASGNNGSFFVRSSEHAVPVYERFGFHISGARTEKEGVIFVPMQLELQQGHD